VVSGLEPTWPAAISCLLDHLAQIAAQFPETSTFPGVLVVDGEPIAYVADNYLAVTGFKDHAIEWHGLGNLRQAETYSITGVIRCYSGDANPTATRALAAQLQNAVQLAFISDPTANGAVRVWHLASSELTQGDTDNGWAAEIEFEIGCEATITVN
jgi:hypothetical protein